MTEIKARFTLEDNYSSQIKAAIDITDKFKESILNTSNTLKDKFILQVKSSNESMDKFKDFTLKAGSALKDNFLPQIKDATEKTDIFSNSILNTLTLLDSLQNKKIQVSIVESVTKSETGENIKPTKTNSGKGKEIQLKSMGMVNEKAGTMTVTAPTKEEISGVFEGFKTLVDAATAVKDFKDLFKKDSNNKFESELNNSTYTNKRKGNKSNNHEGNISRGTKKSDNSIASAIKKYNDSKIGIDTESGNVGKKVSKVLSKGDDFKDAIKSADGFKDALKGIGMVAEGFIMSPNLLIVLGIAAAVLAVYELLTHLKEVKEWLNKCNEAAGEFAKSYDKTGGVTKDTTPDEYSMMLTGKPKSAKKNALGTSYFSGGLTWVGENGPELVQLSAGSKVYNNRESKNMIGSGINVAKLADQIVVREDADIDKIVSKLVSKLTQIEPNMA